MCNIESLPLDCISHIKTYLCDLKKLEQSCVKYYEYLYESQLIKIFNNTYWRIETKIPKYDINLSFDSLIDFTFFNLSSKYWYNISAKNIIIDINYIDSNMKLLDLSKKHSFMSILKSQLLTRRRAQQTAALHLF